MMLNEFDTIASDIILKRAQEQHALMCANGDKCSNWHIRNDYIPRIRREVIAEMKAAVENLSRRA